MDRRRNGGGDGRDGGDGGGGDAGARRAGTMTAPARRLAATLALATLVALVPLAAAAQNPKSETRAPAAKPKRPPAPAPAAQNNPPAAAAPDRAANGREPDLAFGAFQREIGRASCRERV